MVKFYWIIKKKLAVVSVPLDEEDLNTVVENGIKAMVSLYNIADISATWNSLEELLSKIKERGIELISYPVLSGRAPPVEKALELVRWIDSKINELKPVAIGCRRGWGRGGSLAAAYLVYKGYEPREAVEYVSKLAKEHGEEAMETEEQLLLPYKLWELVKNNR